MDKDSANRRIRYKDYEARFDPMRFDRHARRKRKPKPVHHPKVEEVRIVEDLADEIGWENNFQISYKPSKHEAEWLFDSLRPFFEGALISDIFSLVKGGKEASVYCCAAHPTMEVEWLAAKVYRPRKFRGLTKDQIYREGREILRADGKILHENKDRERRALGKKTAFGIQLSQSSWLMHEYRALEVLHRAGGIVPKPYQAAANAILMEFIGSGNLAAPMLSTIQLNKSEAQRHFDLIIENIELMLQHDLIHADLSAYNILYHKGEIVIIDLPQVVESRRNHSAPGILARDLLRVCEYFREQGVKCDPNRITQDLWERYLHVPGHILRADESQLANLYPDVFGDPMG